MYYHFKLTSFLILKFLCAESPISTGHMIMISYFIISHCKQSTTYSALITFFIIYSQDTIFVKLFYNRSTAPILIKNCCNKFIDCIFSSVENNWLAKSVVNAHNFTNKNARNMLLTFFSTGSTTVFTNP